MRNYFLIVLGIVLALSLFTSNGMCQGQPGGRHAGGEDMHHPDMRGQSPGDGPGHHGRYGTPDVPPPHVLIELGATDDQIKALENAEFEHRKQGIDHRSRIEKAELDLEKLMRNSNVSEKSVIEVVDALNQARGNQFKSDILFRLNVNKILGDELMQKMRDHRPSHGRGADRPRPDHPARHGQSAPNPPDRLPPT